MIHISIFNDKEHMATFEEKEIKGLEIKMAKDKNRDLLSTIVLTGKILVPDKKKEVNNQEAFKKNKDMREKLFNWSKSYEVFELACMVLYYNSEKIEGNDLIEYKANFFDEVYLVDYAENFDSESGIGTFHLFLKQKKGSKLVFTVKNNWDDIQYYREWVDVKSGLDSVFFRDIKMNDTSLMAFEKEDKE